MARLFPAIFMVWGLALAGEHAGEDRPLAANPDTLLLLAFEKPFDPFETFVKGDVAFIADGRFGNALRQGADAYVAMSAEDCIDPREGSIEVWVRFLTPGDDRVSRTIVEFVLERDIDQAVQVVTIDGHQGCHA